MEVVLGLHIVVELAVGLLFLFYPEIGDVVPGFGDGKGNSHYLLIKMYGLAALFLSAVGVIAFLKRRTETKMSFLLVALLSGFHFLMAAVQIGYNPDTRASLLHFLLGLFLAAIYVRRDQLIPALRGEQ